MKAFQLQSYSGPSGLNVVQVAAPAPGPDDLLVDVAAVGINFPDLLMTQGNYQLKPTLPFVPGCEIAGTVRSAPSGSGWKVGDAVSAFVWTGGFAEQAVVPLSHAASVPEGMDLERAAATIVNYQTVLFALQRRAALRAGEKVLVLGAGGGIGSAAIQVARGLGTTVIAGVAGTHQAQVAQQAGADDVVVLEPGFAGTVRERHGLVDVVVDPLGDWLFDDGLRTLGPEGRLVVIGFAAGQIPQVKVNRLLLKNIAVIGAAWGAYIDVDPQMVGSQAAWLAEKSGQGFIDPPIDVVGVFEDIPALLHRLAKGDIKGKAVVRL